MVCLTCPLSATASVCCALNPPPPPRMLSQPELSCKAPPAPAARWFIRCPRAGLESWSLQLLESYLDFVLSVVELDQSQCQCPMQPCKQSCQCNCKCSRCRGRWQPRCCPQRCGAAARLALCSRGSPGAPCAAAPARHERSAAAQHRGAAAPPQTQELLGQRVQHGPRSGHAASFRLQCVGGEQR